MPEGSWLEGPPGDFTFAFPRIAADTRGALHVVWAEPAAGTPDDAKVAELSRNVSSLWHAELRGGRWSTPERLYTGIDLNWDPVQTSTLIADEAGTLHLAFAAVDSAGRPELVHLRWDGSTWSRDGIRMPGAPVYVDLTAGRGGNLVMSYVFHHRDSLGSHTNTVFVTRSRDGGRTWSAASPVSRPAQGPGYEPRLARGRGDTLHLVWTQHDSVDDSRSVALWHTRSADGGASWEPPVHHPVSGMTHQTQVLAAPCGGVHAVFSDFGSQSMVHARLTAGGAEMRTPFAGITGNPVLRIDARGTLHLVWTETTVTSPTASTWNVRLLHSTLPACGLNPR